MLCVIFDEAGICNIVVVVVICSTFNYCNLQVIKYGNFLLRAIFDKGGR